MINVGLENSGKKIYFLMFCFMQQNDFLMGFNCSFIFFNYDSPALVKREDPADTDA